MIWPYVPLEALAASALADRQRGGQMQVTAVDLFTGATLVFTVFHQGDVIIRIQDPQGITLLRHAEQFTEVAEAFHIDRRRALTASDGGPA